MAALQSGDLSRAAADLAAAVRDGENDPAVIGALGYALMATGRGAEAVPLLSGAVDRHPGHAGLASDLARLLVTIEPASLRQPARALELAVRANDATGGSDPRILDTLALALAATGRRQDAADALEAAVAFAREAGDVAMANELADYQRNPELRLKHGAAGLEFAKTMDWDEINAAVMHVYERVIERRRRMAKN